MIWIEILGLPASGKSSCASMALAALRRRGINACGRDEGVGRCLGARDGLLLGAVKRLIPRVGKRLNDTDYAMPELCLFASENPTLVSSVISAMARRPLQPADRRSGLVPTFRTFAEYMLASSLMGPSDIIVHDEGLAHRCYTLFGYLNEPVPIDEIRTYVQNVPRIDYAIWTDVSPETSESRIERRALGAPRSWFANLSVGDRVACLGRGRACLTAIAESLSARKIPLLRVNNELPQGNAEKTIEAWAETVESELRGRIRS